MSHFKLRILILIALLIPNLGFSDEATRFKQAALNFIDKAKVSGHLQIEGITLQEMRKATREVMVQHNPDFTVGVGNRRCAMWQSEHENVHAIGSEKTINLPARIFLNKRCADLSDLDLGPIAVHEVLGAKFNRDLNYEVTTRMSSINQDLSPEQLNWKMNRQQVSRGGSTGVGGGGDDDDLRFKLEGLKTLESLSKSRETLFGIPVTMLKEALHQMQVSPASDVDKFMQFWSRDSERTGKEKATVVVQSHFYRSKDSDLGLWALYAARLFVMYSPYELGFVEKPEDEDAFTLQQLRNLRKKIVEGDPFSIAAYSFETSLIRKTIKTDK